MLSPLFEVVHHVHQVREGLVGVVVEHLVDADRLGLALDDDVVDLADAVGALAAS